MTKKDYELLASVMRQTLPAETGPAFAQWWHMLNVLNTELSMTNPRFDYQRFRRACYGETK